MFEFLFNRPSVESIMKHRELKRRLMDTVSDTKLIDCLIRSRSANGEDITELKKQRDKAIEFRIINDFPI
jgi:hypothetical protein